MSFYLNLYCTIINKIKVGGYIMIKQYRLAKNLSQEELTKEIGISWRQLQRLEEIIKFIKK